MGRGTSPPGVALVVTDPEPVPEDALFLSSLDDDPELPCEEEVDEVEALLDVVADEVL